MCSFFHMASTSGSNETGKRPGRFRYETRMRPDGLQRANRESPSRRAGERCRMEAVTLLNIKVQDFLSCPNCGNPSPRKLGKCCNGACRVALHRWRMRKPECVASNPVVRIGTRSLKALRSDTYGLERKLTASSVIIPSENAPANVKAWASSRVRTRTK